MYNKHNKHASRWSKAHSVSQLAGTPFASVFWEHFHRAVALRAGAHCLCEVVQVDIVEAEQVVAGEAPDGGHLRMVGSAQAQAQKGWVALPRRSMLVL